MTPVDIASCNGTPAQFWYPAPETATLDLRASSFSLNGGTTANPVSLCGNGTGYRPGAEIHLYASNTPVATGNMFFGVGYADSNGNLSFSVNVMSGSPTCTPAQLAAYATVTTEDILTGQMGQANFPAALFCSNGGGGSYRGGC
jgi:hypothetical protein